MTKLPTPKSEGDKMDCPDCNMPLVARLKTYKDNAFPAYVQWQDEKETKAHKTKDGNCNGITTSGSAHVPETITQSTITQKSTTESNTSSGQTNGVEEQLATLNLKVESIYAMIKVQFDEYQERKNQ